MNNNYIVPTLVKRPTVEIIGLTAVMESDTAYIIPRLDATLLDIMVESNSVNGKRHRSIKIRLHLNQSMSRTKSIDNVGL